MLETLAAACSGGPNSPAKRAGLRDLCPIRRTCTARAICGGTRDNTNLTPAGWRLQTGPATNIPPSRELLAFIARKSLRHVKPGMIVGFTGRAPPVGWRLCDGSNGSPDLRGLYLMLTREKRTDGQQGENAPRHDASHSHTWGLAVTDSQVNTNWGFFGGTAPTPQPDFNVSGLSHAHTASEPVGWSGQTDVDNVAPRPPSIVVMFIQATAVARTVPAGALLPFTGESLPSGCQQYGVLGRTSVQRRKNTYY